MRLVLTSYTIRNPAASVLSVEVTQFAASIFWCCDLELVQWFVLRRLRKTWWLSNMFASNSIFFIGEPNRTTLRPICRRKMCRLTLLLKTWTAPDANNQAPSWTIGLCLGSGCFSNVIIVRKVERPSFYAKPLDMNMILPKIGRTRCLYHLWLEKRIRVSATAPKKLKTLRKRCCHRIGSLVQL